MPGGPLPVPKTKEEAVKVVVQAANQAQEAAAAAKQAVDAAKQALKLIQMSPGAELRAQEPIPEKLPEIPGLSPARQAAIARNQARSATTPAAEVGPKALPKAVKPEARVGWHVDQQPSSWDMVYRAEMSYEEMAPYSDFIKLILPKDQSKNMIFVK